MTKSIHRKRGRNKTVKRIPHIVLWLPRVADYHPLTEAIVDVVQSWPGDWAITRDSQGNYHAFGDASGIMGVA